MMLQRLATGATGVKQARYRRRPTQRGTRTRMRSIYTTLVLLLNVRPAYEFRRGFCTLVLFIYDRFYDACVSREIFNACVYKFFRILWEQFKCHL